MSPLRLKIPIALGALTLVLLPTHLPRWLDTVSPLAREPLTVDTDVFAVEALEMMRARNINNELRRQAAAHDNVVVVNWSKKADQHPDWFLSDGLHLNAAGRAGYARVLDTAADC